MCLLLCFVVSYLLWNSELIKQRISLITQFCNILISHIYFSGHIWKRYFLNGFCYQWSHWNRYWKLLIQQPSRHLLNILPYNSSLWLPRTPPSNSTVLWGRQVPQTKSQILLTSSWPMGFRGCLKYINALWIQLSAELGPLILQAFLFRIYTERTDWSAVIKFY